MESNALISQAGILTAYPHGYTLQPGQDRSAAASFRARVRSGEITNHTSGHASDFVQVTDAGNPRPSTVAPDADLRTDIPKYRVFIDGKLDREIEDATSLWSGDMVGFLIGCSFSWESELAAAGLCPRNVEEGRNVSMFKTNIPNVASGRFKGFLVVSMRPYLPKDTDRVRDITSRYAGAHGGPVHVGNPAAIGIEPERLGSPDFGDAVTIRDEEVPVFWACGVTPQSAIADAGLPLVLTHAPGCMFITDVRTSEMKAAPPGP